MSINNQQPITGATLFGTQLSRQSDSNMGIIHANIISGGFHQVETIAERNAIPVYDSGSTVYNGFSVSGNYADGITSGRRSIGMLVKVLEDGKLYTLIPAGFYGNGGALDADDFRALEECERAVRIFPEGSFIKEGASPGNGFTPVIVDASTYGISSDPNSVWVEISLAGQNGADGADVDYSTTFDGPHSLGDDRNPGADLGAVTVDTGLSYIGGEYIIVSMNADPGSFDIAQVTSYNSETGEMHFNNVYQSTVDSNSTDWNINLTGVPGINGEAGTSGTSGVDGSNGTNGTSGTSGTSGSSGSNGSSGSSGSSGNHGTSGVNGTSGTDGSSGVNGTSGTDGSSGNDGTSGTDGTNGVDGSSGTSGVSGDPGQNGEDGTSGTSGIDGSSGTSAIDGTSGTSGVDGSNGTSGNDGSNGTSGTSGKDGSNGQDGTNGTSGTSGVSNDGTSGTSGTSGTDGGRGEDGTSGTSGVDGLNGTSGTSGINGTSGTDGGQGEPGQDGTSGTSGLNGTSGTSGKDGSNGQDGTNGTSGTSGVSNDGTSGTSGVSGTSGTSGVDGTSGTSGKDGGEGQPGQPGTSGTDGADGTSGTSGTDGARGEDGTSGTSGIDGTSGTDGARGGDGSSGTSGTSASGGSSTTQYLLRLEYDSTGHLVNNTTDNTFVGGEYETSGASVNSVTVSTETSVYSVNVGFSNESLPPINIMVMAWDPDSKDYQVHPYRQDSGNLRYITGLENLSDNDADGQWVPDLFGNFGSTTTIDIDVRQLFIKYGDAIAFPPPGYLAHAYILFVFSDSQVS